MFSHPWLPPSKRDRNDIGVVRRTSRENSATRSIGAVYWCANGQSNWRHSRARRTRADPANSYCLIAAGFTPARTCWGESNALTRTRLVEGLAVATSVAPGPEGRGCDGDWKQMHQSANCFPVGLPEEGLGSYQRCRLGPANRPQPAEDTALLFLCEGVGHVGTRKIVGSIHPPRLSRIVLVIEDAAVGLGVQVGRQIHAGYDRLQVVGQ